MKTITDIEYEEIRSRFDVLSTKGNERYYDKIYWSYSYVSRNYFYMSPTVVDITITLKEYIYEENNIYLQRYRVVLE